MKIINIINNELIDIREYAKPKAYFNLQLDNPSEYYEFCIFHEQFNPFDLFNDNKIKDKEIERLNNIINELENILVEKLDAINDIRNTFGEKARIINPDINGIEMGYKDIQSILKELKGDSSNE